MYNPISFFYLGRRQRHLFLFLLSDMYVLTALVHVLPPSSQRLLCASVLALLCAYVTRCALRSHQWRSEQSLFTSALAVCPLNAKVNISRAAAAHAPTRTPNGLVTDSSGALQRR